MEDWLRTFEDQTILQGCDTDAMRMKLLPALMKEKALTVVPKLHTKGSYTEMVNCLKKEFKVEAKDVIADLRSLQCHADNIKKYNDDFNKILTQKPDLVMQDLYVK